MISKILPVCLVALSSGCSLIGGKPYVPETKAVEVVTVTKQAVVQPFWLHQSIEVIVFLVVRAP